MIIRLTRPHHPHCIESIEYCISPHVGDVYENPADFERRPADLADQAIWNDLMEKTVRQQLSQTSFWILGGERSMHNPTIMVCTMGVVA